MDARVVKALLQDFDHFAVIVEFKMPKCVLKPETHGRKEGKTLANNTFKQREFIS